MLPAHHFLGFWTGKTEPLRFLVLWRLRAFTWQKVEGNHGNTHFTIQFITCGLNGKKFSDLLPYMATGRKTIIHCWTLDQVSHVYAYIWRLQPDSVNKLIWMQMYHSINPPESNEEMIRLINDDPRCQIIRFSTVAFSNRQLKGELKGDSNMVDDDFWRLVGDESREELNVEGRRGLKYWGISGMAAPQ